MKPVICFGEALIDLLQINTPSADGLPLADFRQFPGGAPANAAVAIAKLGGKAQFCGQVGKDTFGDFLINALKHYHVDCQYTFQHPTAKTALAFVSLDEHGERSFSFYRDNSADVLFTPEQFNQSCFESAGIFHFCSNTLTEQSITNTTHKGVLLAKEHGLLVSFDVNLRHNLWASGSADIERVNQLVWQSDVVKFAKEELTYLACDNASDYIKQCFNNGCKLLIVTNGGEPLDYYFTQNGKIITHTITPPKSDTVDSTAAGDAFIGGVLYGLSQFQEPLKVLNSPQKLEHLITSGSHCGAHTVARQGAFVALPKLCDIPALNNTVNE